MVLWFFLALWTGPLAASDAVRTAAALERQAAERCRLGHCIEAERLQTQALSRWEEAARTRPVDLAIPNANLAQIYLATGKLTAAERHAEAAARLQAQSNASAAEQARVITLLAKIRFQQSRFSEAAELQEGVVRALEVPGATGPGILAVALNDLAMMQAAGGDLRRARTLLERSVAIHRRPSRTAEGGLGEVLGNLALVCVRQGDYRAADPLYREAISTVEASLGPAHPHLGMLFAEHAKVLKKTDQKPEAKQAELRAKAILGSATELAGRNAVDASALRRPRP
ncbi:MAG: tetratricopeptide repeat protein [Bryobacteraceae bacterium]